MDNEVIFQLDQLCCTHHSKTVRTQSISQHGSHPQSHHPRCPSRLGTGSQSHHHQHQQLLLLLLYLHRHRHPPLLQHLAIQVAAGQTLAAASRTARGVPASNPSSGTSGRSNFSAGSLRILIARLVVCSRRRPCCGGCTGSTSRAREKRAEVEAVPAGATLMQVALVQWKHHQHAQMQINFKSLHFKYNSPSFSPYFTLG